MTNLALIFTITATLISNISAFGSFKFPSIGGAAAPKTNDPNVQEAIDIYNNKYASSSTFKPFYNSWGLPTTDFDGTKVKSDKPNKKLFSVDENERKATFLEIAKLYGSDEALQMTKILPGVLAFDRKNMAQSLEEFTTIFGEEEAKAMVMRNPGLLYVKPENAATSDDLTMQFSYIVSVTRPAGPVLLYGVLGLLCIPVLEGVTGVSKADFIASLGF